ncbi:hypothetical protein Ac2012v2_008053 [Leucoagaricus gongylophorus]
MTLMTSTHAYTALNIKCIDLVQSHREDETTRSFESCSSSWGKLQRVIRDAYQRNLGLLLVIGSQIFLSLVNVAVKKLHEIDPPVSALEVCTGGFCECEIFSSCALQMKLIVVRMGITWICSVAYMILTGVPDPFMGPEGVRLLLIFRGVSGFFGLIGVYFSLQYLSLSDATVLTFLSPLCTAASGALFLGEKFSRKEVFAGFFSLAGVVLIARPLFIFGTSNEEPIEIMVKEVTPKQRLIAVGVALIGVLGATGAYTSLRAIGKRAHPLHSLVMFSFYSVFVACVGMIVTKTPLVVPTRLEWLGMLFMIGIFGFFAQVGARFIMFFL